jgi:hypothetical protein
MPPAALSGCDIYSFEEEVRLLWDSFAGLGNDRDQVCNLKQTMESIKQENATLRVSLTRQAEDLTEIRRRSDDRFVRVGALEHGELYDSLRTDLTNLRQLLSQLRCRKRHREGPFLHP